MQNNIFSKKNIGHEVITLESVSSTNDYLKELLSKSDPVTEGTVIMAVEQTAGRGQQGTTWISEKGKNLSFTLLLCPSFLNPNQQFQLNIAISLAIYNYLQKYVNGMVKIKWPNDIYVSDQKICGILIENVLYGKQWKYAVVGIGFNLNQTDFGGLEKQPTSLKKLTEKTFGLEEELIKICECIEQTYQWLKAENYEKLRQRYHQVLYRKDIATNFLVCDVPVSGIIRGIDNYGKLLVDFNGHVTDFGIKEIQMAI